MAMSISVESAMQGKTILWGAPTYDQVRIGFAETKKSAGDYASFNISRMEVDFPTYGKILFRSLDDPDNARGFTADGVVIDECGDVKREAWYEVLRPMLIDTHGWSWGIGTPRGRNWFWEEHTKASDDNDAISWQVPTLGVEIVGGEVVRKQHPLENPFIPFDEIVKLFHTMPRYVFQQEILAQFVESETALFRRVMECATGEQIDGAQDGRQYIAGVDVATLVDYTVVSVFDVESKAQVYLDRFNRCDYSVLEDRLAALYARFNMTSMTVESNSIGQSVIEALVSRGLAIQAFTTTSATKQAAIQALQAAFEHGEISILPDPVQVGELQSFEGERTPSGAWKYAAPEGMHDDTVMAMAIAWSGLLRPTGADMIAFV